MSVKRYTQPVVQTTPEPGFHIEEVPLFEDPRGKYVLVSDYDALAARIAALESELKFQKYLLAQYHRQNIADGNGR